VTLKLIPQDDPSSAPTPPTGRGGNNPAGNYLVVSDALGNFVFSEIVPGRYSISAERQGYLRQERFKSGPGPSNEFALTVVAGQKIEGLVVAMTSVPTISGVVYSPYGQRLAGASIQAYRVQYTPYGRQLIKAATVLSHEGGEYRLYHLTPGYYYISASYSGHALQAWKSLLEIAPNLSNPDEGFSTVYFPGAMRIVDARAINLNNGGVSNVDIGFKESRYFKLSINLVLPPPLPPIYPKLQNPKIALFPAGTDLGSAQDYVVRGAGTRFSVDRLAEGDYVVVAVADFRDALGNVFQGIVSDTMAVRVTQNTEVSVVTMDPFEIPGNVIRPPNGSPLAGIQIQLVRVDPLASQTISASIDSSGQFNLNGVGPGTYDVFLQGLPRNAYLQEARLPNGDRRLLQVRIDANLPPRSWHCDGGDCIPRLISDVKLSAIFSTNGVTLNGNVIDGQGGKAAGAVAVLVPIDPVARLRKDRYGVAFSDASGAFQLQGIPPGAYTAYAFEEIEPDIYFDPEFNAQIAPLGRTVMLVTGINRPLDRPLTMITKDDLARYTR